MVAQETVQLREAALISSQQTSLPLKQFLLDNTTIQFQVIFNILEFQESILMLLRLKKNSILFHEFCLDIVTLFWHIMVLQTPKGGHVAIVRVEFKAVRSHKYSNSS